MYALCLDPVIFNEYVDVQVKMQSPIVQTAAAAGMTETYPKWRDNFILFMFWYVVLEDNFNKVNKKRNTRWF